MRFFSLFSIIIFLFLLDSDGTSRIVLLTVGVSLFIDLWKVSKVAAAGAMFNSSHARLALWQVLKVPLWSTLGVRLVASAYHVAGAHDETRSSNQRA